MRQKRSFQGLDPEGSYFWCGLCSESYYDEYVRHLNVRTGEHIGISSLTKTQVKPKNSSVANHLLFCNHSTSYDNFSILTRENKKVLTRTERKPVNNER